MNKTGHRCFALITVILVLYSINGILCRSHHYDSYNEDLLEGRESPTGPISEPDWFEKYMQTNECGKHKKPARSIKSRRRNSNGVHHGREAHEGEFPSYIKLMQFPKNSLYGSECGGVLLSPDLVLTAAHCFLEAYDTLYAISGARTMFPFETTKSNTKKVARACVSNEFNTTSFASHDIAVVRLYNEFELNFKVDVACLPNQQVKMSDDIQLVGKGTRSENLQEVVFNLQALGMQKVECEGRHRDFGKLCTRTNEKNGKGGPCMGDSGGPLYKDDHGRQTVVGITSYGHNNLCRDLRFETMVSSDTYVLRDKILDLVRLCADDKTESRKRIFHRSSYEELERKYPIVKLD